MSEPPADREIRVLLVDDHHLVAEALADALNEQPTINVVGRGSSVRDVRRMVRDLSPDVVLMDYYLPDGTGADGAREVFAERPKTRVLIVTASEEEEETLAQALDAGCSGYIGKSSGIQELVNAVHSVHAGDAVLPSSLLRRVVKRRAQPEDPVPFGLTPREVDILRLLADGAGTRWMADHLGVTLHTTRNYVQSVIQKLDAHSKLEAVAIARRAGVIPPPRS